MLKWLCSIAVLGAAFILQVNCHGSSRFSRRLRLTRYDVGCYKEVSKLKALFATSTLKKGTQTPSCIAGGLFRSVQCDNNNCFCVYIDTGKRHGTLSLINSSYRELLLKCPKKPEKAIVTCKSPPLNYPCNLWERKYLYSSESNRCEQTSYGCYGFLSKEKCESNCGNVTVVLETKSRRDLGGSVVSRFRLVIPASLLRRFKLRRHEVNRVTTRTFTRVLGFASAMKPEMKPRHQVYGTTQPTSTISQLTTTMSTPPPSTTLSEEMIERSKSTPDEVCQQLPETGFCRGYYFRWYFDPSDSTCKRFVYGGCSANGNNFVTKGECDAYCREHTTTNENEEQSISGSS